MLNSKAGMNSAIQRKNHYLVLVKSNKWSIINATFWLVELPLGYTVNYF